MDVKDTVISGRPLQGYYPAELILGDRGDSTTSLTELIRSWTSELDSGVKRQGGTGKYMKWERTHGCGRREERRSKGHF